VRDPLYPLRQFVGETTVDWKLNNEFQKNLSRCTLFNSLPSEVARVYHFPFLHIFVRVNQQHNSVYNQSTEIVKAI
jgi:hypothetical protein